MQRRSLEKAIRNLSPEGVVAVIAYLQPAEGWHPTNEHGARAQREVESFADALLDAVGLAEHNRLIDKIGL